MLENFNIINCEPKLISLSVRISLSTNNSPIDEKKVAKIKKISYYEILKLLI